MAQIPRHIRGTTRVVKASKKITEKRLKSRGTCNEDERGAHSEKNASREHTREKKKKRAVKPMGGRCL